MAIGQRLVGPLFELYLRRCWYDSKIATAHRMLRAHSLEEVRSIIVEIDEDYLCTFGSSAQSVYELLQAEGFSPHIRLGARPHCDEIFSRLP